MNPDVKLRDCIVVEPTGGGFPPLMFLSAHRLSRAAAEYFRSEVTRALREEKAIIVEDMKVYQLIDGRWEPLP